MKKSFKFRHIKALLKGFVISNYLKFINRGRFKAGAALRMYSGSELRTTKNSKVNFGKWITIDKDSLISVLKNGNLFIAAHVGISSNSRIICHNQIEIGEGTILGPNVMIYDHDHKFDRTGVKQTEFITSPVKIGKNCWIGASSIILKGTIVGDNCVIAAGSIVHGNIPDNTLYVQKRQTTMKEIDYEY